MRMARSSGISMPNFTEWRRAKKPVNVGGPPYGPLMATPVEQLIELLRSATWAALT
jgi:hypothetical protein